jgi:hypothetical protein
MSKDYLMRAFARKLGSPLVGLGLVVAGFGVSGVPARPAYDEGCHAATHATPLIGPSVPTAVAPVAQGVCRGVRPGAMVLMPGAQCTFNFVFRGSDRQTYIGTAGHCPLLDVDGEKRWTGYAGPYAADGGGRTIGHFVYAVLGSANGLISPIDFGLIRLNPDTRWSAQMCYFGGPDGMYTRHEPTPLVVEFFGNSPAYRDVLPARSGLAPDTTDAYAVDAFMPVAHGDSGSGVIDQAGEAVGVLSEGVGVDGPNGAVVGQPSVLSRLDVGVARAERALHIKLALVHTPVN